MKKQRRAQGEGTIYRRSDGRWCAQITVGTKMKNGVLTRDRKTISATTKTQVAEKMNRIRGNPAIHASDTQRVTVASWFEHWLENDIRPRVRRNTYLLYGHIVRKHIVPHIGGIPLSKLTAARVQQFYAELRNGDRLGRTCQAAHTRLKQALRAAVRQDIVARNVCDLVQAPRSARKEIQPLSLEQAASFLRAARTDRLYPLYLLAVTTGLRQGELFALRWENIDFANRTLAVRGTLLEDEDGKLVVGEPKTAHSRRSVALDSFIVRALAEHRTDGALGSDFVFTDGDGKPLRKSNVIRRSFKPLLKSAGLPAIRFHDLRHTAATLLLARGEHPKVAQERLGHATIGMTMDTYSHVLPGMQHAAAERLGAALFCDSTAPTSSQTPSRVAAFASDCADIPERSTNFCQ